MNEQNTHESKQTTPNASYTPYDGDESRIFGKWMTVGEGVDEQGEPFFRVTNRATDESRDVVAADLAELSEKLAPKHAAERTMGEVAIGAVRRAAHLEVPEPSIPHVLDKVYSPEEIQGIRDQLKRRDDDSIIDSDQIPR